MIPLILTIRGDLLIQNLLSSLGSGVLGLGSTTLTGFAVIGRRDRRRLLHDLHPLHGPVEDLTAFLFNLQFLSWAYPCSLSKQLILLKLRFVNLILGVALRTVRKDLTSWGSLVKTGEISSIPHDRVLTYIFLFAIFLIVQIDYVLSLVEWIFSRVVHIFNFRWA